MWQLDQPLSRELQDTFGEQPARTCSPRCG
jgi:hypothetical protein